MPGGHGPLARAQSHSRQAGRAVAVEAVRDEVPETRHGDGHEDQGYEMSGRQEPALDLCRRAGRIDHISQRTLPR
jgi:hypothetical protein